MLSETGNCTREKSSAYQTHVGKVFHGNIGGSIEGIAIAARFK
jgi:hypothetical protein